MNEGKRRRIIRVLLPRFGVRCWYCGIKLTDSTTHVDHIIPKSLGGSDSIFNLALACKHCNSAKGGSPVEEFLAWLEHVRCGGETLYKPLLEEEKTALALFPNANPQRRSVKERKQRNKRSAPTGTARRGELLHMHRQEHVLKGKTDINCPLCPYVPAKPTSEPFYG